MQSILEKARQNPESIKAKILSAARRIFGEYGFHGTTMRMIARDVGIDISSLHYHWGEKKDLYEAVIIDINNDLGKKLTEVERSIRGKPLEERIAIGIDVMTDYLFNNPEISNLVLYRYFTKTRYEASQDLKVPEFTRDIVHSMGLGEDAEHLPQSMASVLAIMNSIHNFIAGENVFGPVIKLEKENYRQLVKKTLKSIFIAAFVRDTANP
ncbi:MAG: TetR/AcrR family transcriptional regulator [Syntrophales bacterium]|jgi:AcrR family transcriptional regulator|nr:TetR/AcrR family transcriptional regulator [Syntrophales bacterium]MCK9527932.1 TetR/AcrR family transcriptional regulator [Syntrophales bacterium]MDX9921892.1 TetR/AcrR family transcriptional regulator [Syntrophales bacterium]